MNAAHCAVIASIANVCAAANPTFFCTIWNSASACWNCRRVLACVTIASTHTFAWPVQVAPNVVRPKFSTVSAACNPRPILPRMFSFGTRMSVNVILPVAVPRMPHFSARASTTWKPGMSGVTRNAVTLPFGPFGSGVRAITVRMCAMPPLVM